MSGESPASEPAWVTWLGMVLLCLCAALAALLEALLVPLYVGSTIAPVAVLLAVVSNFAFPRMGYRMLPRLAGAGLPFAVWIVVIFVFGVMGRPEGDVILPGGSGPEPWVAYGVMLGGALVGTITVVIAAPPASRRPPGGPLSSGRGSPQRPAQPPGRR